MKTLYRISLILNVVAYSHIACAQKSICITVDDLPVVSLDTSIERHRYITSHLLTTLNTHDVPAIGFVNEVKLSPNGKPSRDRQALLKSWFTHGIELGNHTYSHPDFNTHTPGEFVNEIIKGGEFTDQLFKGVRNRIRYFRHPFLHTGNTIQKKTALSAIVQKLGYIEAPVTVDNADYIFARAYDIARQKNDTVMAKQIGKEYVPYMMSKVHYYESQSIALFGKNISHILLMHANSINADYLSDLLVALKKDGYQLKSLAETLNDPLYKTNDNFVGSAGISWIHRWAISRGKSKDFFGKEPRTPDFILTYSGFESE